MLSKRMFEKFVFQGENDEEREREHNRYLMKPDPLTSTTDWTPLNIRKICEDGEVYSYDQIVQLFAQILYLEPEEIEDIEMWQINRKYVLYIYRQNHILLAQCTIQKHHLQVFRKCNIVSSECPWRNKASPWIIITFEQQNELDLICIFLLEMLK